MFLVALPASGSSQEALVLPGRGLATFLIFIERKESLQAVSSFEASLGCAVGVIAV